MFLTGVVRLGFSKVPSYQEATELMELGWFWVWQDGLFPHYKGASGWRICPSPGASE
jgi:hypothetical protein